jgi:hypothetical protein
VTSEIEQLIAADLDCTSAVQRLMRAQADLVLYVEERETPDYAGSVLISS